MQNQWSYSLLKRNQEKTNRVTVFFCLFCFSAGRIELFLYLFERIEKYTLCVWESVWGWAWCYRVIKNMPSILGNHRAGCHGNAAGSSSSSHQWAQTICYRGKPGLLPRRPEAVCSSSNGEFFLLGCLHRQTVSTAGVWGQYWSVSWNLSDISYRKIQH